MKNNNIHTNYLSMLAVKLSISNIQVKDLNKNEFTYKNKKIVLENIRINTNESGILLPLTYKSLNLNWFIDEYLYDFQIDSDYFPSGGIYFADTKSNEIIETNFDLGESEEWEIILKELISKGESFHTFSATEEAIEIKNSDGDIFLQMLDWEAIPDRIETSRQTQPVHVFKDSNFFLSQIENCVKTIKNIYSEIEKSTKDNKESLMFYFSIAFRRN